MCRYCRGDYMLLNTEIVIPSGYENVSDDYFLFIKDNQLILNNNDNLTLFDYSKKIKIHFCPMCGQELI